MKTYLVRYMIKAEWHEVEVRADNIAIARLKVLVDYPDANIGGIEEL